MRRFTFCLGVLLWAATAFAQERDRDEELYIQRVDNGDGTFTARVFTFPVNYRDGDGNLHPIVLDAQAATVDGEDAFRLDKTPVTVEVRESGRTALTSGDYTISMWPRYLATDNVSENRRGLGSRNPNLSKLGSTRLKIQQYLPGGIHAELLMMPDGVKETFTLPESVRTALPSPAKQLIVAWDYDAPGLTPVPDADGGIFWLDASDAPQFFTAPVYLKDAAGAELTIPWILRSGHVAVEVPTAWLKDAARQYPVAVDPTTMASGFDMISTTTLKRDGNVTLLKFDLPDIGAGSTLTSAALKMYVVSDWGEQWETPYPTVNYYTTSDTSWVLSPTPTAGATVNAWPTGPLLGSFRPSTAGFDAGAWVTLAVTGTTASSHSIASAYNGSTNPGNWGVKFDSDGDSGSYVYTNDTLMYFTTDRGDYGLEIAAPLYADTTKRPYLEVTYSAGVVAPGAATSPTVNGSSANPVYTTDTTPTLSWTAPAGGMAPTGYKVYVDGTLKTTVSHPTTSYTVSPALTANGAQHTWSVVATNTYGDAPALTGNNFYVGTVPAAPTALRVGGSSANPVYTTDTTPTLSWTAPAGGMAPTGYKVYVDGTLKTTVSHPTTSYTVSPALTANGAQHTWSVVATNAYGDATGANGNPFYVGTVPAAPTALRVGGSSANPVYTTDTTPTLSWTAPAGGMAPTGYKVYVDGTLKTTVSHPTTSYTVSPALAANGAQHTWSVVATNAYGDATGTNGNPFYVGVVPSAPQLVDIASKTSGTYPTFYTTTATQNVTWNAPASGTGPILRYELKIGAGAYGTVTSPSSQTFSAGANTVYLRAVNNYGNGADATFTVNLGTAPSGVSLSTPANNGYTTDTTPLFDWTTGTGSTPFYYDVYIDGALATTVGNSAYTPTEPLAYGSHTWYVVHRSAWGSVTSSTYTFGLGTAPSAFALVGPATATKVERSAQSSTTLDWGDATASGGTTATVTYTLEIDRGAGFVVEKTGLTSSTTTLASLAGGPLPVGIHTWRVQAVNNYGTTVSTESWTLDVGDVPGVPTAVAVANATHSTGGNVFYLPNTALTQNVTWNAPASGTGAVTGYRIRLNAGAYGAATSPKSTTFNANAANTVDLYATNAYGNGAVFSFTVYTSDPPAVASLALTNAVGGSSTTSPNYTTDPTASFAWAHGGGEGTKYYKIEYATAADGFTAYTQTVADQTGTTYTTPALAAETAYRWRFTPWSVYGWGTPVVFEVTSGSGAGASALLAPVSPFTTREARPVFSWLAASGSGTKTYKLYLNGVEQASGAALEYTPATPLAPGTYVWKVNASSVYTPAGTDSEERTLTILPPQPSGTAGTPHY